jgi:predicted nucleotidyltransferase component of viral defense system
LLSESEASGFRPEVLEKVIYLLALLERFASHPFLGNRLALKGGTAVNLFLFDLPRLSVDLDLNYLGSAGRETMQAERPDVEHAIQTVCAREEFTVRRIPMDHAGGKWSLRYESALGQGGNLEIDLNFMFRVPLWPPVRRDSHQAGSYRAHGILVLDVHELAAGKLAALFTRRQPRDLFDVHQLLHHQSLDPARLRLAFVAYGAMNRRDWRTVSVEDVSFDPRDVQNQLLPLLRRDSTAESGDVSAFSERLVQECRDRLAAVLPLSEAEREFLDNVLDRGAISTSLLTEDAGAATRLARHPLLQWKALNVRQHIQKQASAD